MTWIDVIYNIITLIGTLFIVHCTMWSLETQLSFAEMNWKQRGKVIIAKITIWSMILFLGYILAGILFFVFLN